MNADKIADALRNTRRKMLTFIRARSTTVPIEAVGIWIDEIEAALAEHDAQFAHSPTDEAFCKIRDWLGPANDDNIALELIIKRLVAQPAQAAQPVGTVTDEMVQRFLGWRLPDTFAPDCYVSFDREGIKKMGNGSHWPTGTNLLNDPEARAMLEHVLAAAPQPAQPAGDLRVEIRAVAVSDASDAHQVWLRRGVQQFPVGDYRDTREEAEWYANQLQTALQPVGVPDGFTETELGVVETLLNLAYAAWTLADNIEDAGGEGLTVERSDFAGLETHLDKLDSLPDDQPDYMMEASAKARWALRRLLAAPQPPAPPSSRLSQHADLHPATADLVDRFSAALREKLLAAQRKYGYSDNWQRDDWMDECRQHLLDHIAKGDPRDVAAYCAFLWHHGERTTAAQPVPSDIG